MKIYLLIWGKMFLDDIIIIGIFLKVDDFCEKNID